MTQHATSVKDAPIMIGTEYSASSGSGASTILGVLYRGQVFGVTIARVRHIDL